MAQFQKIFLTLLTKSHNVYTILCEILNDSCEKQQPTISHSDYVKHSTVTPKSLCQLIKILQNPLNSY
jgi:hypothetical protein